MWDGHTVAMYSIPIIILHFFRRALKSNKNRWHSDISLVELYLCSILASQPTQRTFTVTHETRDTFISFKNIFYSIHSTFFFCFRASAFVASAIFYSFHETFSAFCSVSYSRACDIYETRTLSICKKTSSELSYPTKAEISESHRATSEWERTEARRKVLLKKKVNQSCRFWMQADGWQLP